MPLDWLARRFNPVSLPIPVGSFAAGRAACDVVVPHNHRASVYIVPRRERTGRKLFTIERCKGKEQTPELPAHRAAKSVVVNGLSGLWTRPSEIQQVP